MILRKADLDDHECNVFASALASNDHIRCFDLSNNILGKSETLNTVHPEVVTGGEALGELLSTASCHLKELLLGWNMIRMEGAEALADGLAKNCHLLHLDLSYNSFGARGGERLGAALIYNQTIEKLNIRNNNINSTACFTICMGILENKSLRSVCFDGNPIGEFGARVLMELPVICGSRVKISAAKCNLTLKYSKDSIIDLEAPSDEYTLHLDDPFQRAVCFKLLSLVAYHPTYVFKRIVYTPPSKQNSPKKSDSKKTAVASARGRGSQAKNRKMTISLVQGVRQNTSVQHEPDKLETIAKLREVRAAAKDKNRIEYLFKKFDVDESGSIDADELKALLADIGLNIEIGALEEAMEKFDIDGMGELQLPELEDFIRAQVIITTSIL